MATNSVDERQQHPTTSGAVPVGTCPMKHLAKAPSGCPMVFDRQDPTFLEHAYEAYAQLREQGAVVRTDFARGFGEAVNPHTPPVQEKVFVTRYDEAVEALLDERLSSDFRAGKTPEQLARMPEIPEEARPIAYSLIMRDAPDHTRLRKLVQPSFTARSMELLRPRIQHITDVLLDRVERQAAERGERPSERRMDLVEAFAYPMPITVISDMLGIPEDNREQVHHWAELLMNTDRFDPALADQRRDQTRAFNAYLETVFEQKRRQPTEDMISQMVHAHEDGDKLSHQELVSMVHILFFAGHVTTVNLIGNGVVALLTHPEQHAKLMADPALAKGMVEETLRYWGPVDFLSSSRILTADLPLGGTIISRGENVTVGLGAANRDPARFPHPDVFDITRPEAHRNIAFGKGIHVCLGAPLARLEGQIAFETLFRRYPQLRLAVPAEQLQWGAGAGLRGFKRIPVLF
jgi:cytochrome P450